MSARIASIKLVVGAREVELSIDDARELHNQLKLIFPEQNTIPVYIPSYVTLSPSKPWESPSKPWEVTFTC